MRRNASRAGARRLEQFHLTKIDLANVLKEMALFCVVRKSGR
jgi:hypothetical protein